MLIDGKPHRTIWESVPGEVVTIIDQTRLPHELRVVELTSMAEAAIAIQTMQVRGAPLIGVCAAYGLALALREDPFDGNLANAAVVLLETRPTAVNLRWAIERMRDHIDSLPPAARADAAFAEARRMADEDVLLNQAIARHGLPVIQAAAARKRPGEPVRILTHCNAGWLATVDWGTALAPVYAAHQAGILLEILVDETRPRNQGAGLTLWELQQAQVPCTLIADNAGGHLMQQGLVDLCLVGADRVAANGDAANKIGTYLKALAARDTGVPFYVCVPAPTIDWAMPTGAGIPIEDRGSRELTHVSGKGPDGGIGTVQIAPDGTRTRNPGFDVTPARLITALITDRGPCPATPDGLAGLFGR